jgi:thiol-disulfide isomerase/thioredoxin
MKTILCCLILLCPIIYSNAQSKAKGLAIGDHVPEVTFSEVINNSIGKTKLSDFTGQLVILDFWATWCSPCISAFPKTDSLNRTLAGKATILPVTYQSKVDVDKLFTKAKKLSRLSIPMVVNDKELHTLFPHNELPHYVWLQDGVVKAVTGFHEVNAANIVSMLNKAVALPEKKDEEILPYNASVPLLFNAVNFASEDLRYESIFTGYKPGFASRVDKVRYPDLTISKFTATNDYIQSIYEQAFGTDYLILKANRVIVEVADKEPFTFPDYAKDSPAKIREWEKKFLFCYELIVPNSISRDFRKLMQEDLKRIFPQYIGKLTPKETRVLALVKTSTLDKVRTHGASFEYTLDGFEATLVNGFVETLLMHFNGMTLHHLKTPVIDETGITDRIDISLKGNMSDVESIRKELQKYDLDLVYKTKTIDMLVISDASNHD